MSLIPATIAERAEQYVKIHSAKIDKRLGWGQDGWVFATDTGSAIKVFKYEKQYRQELQVYLRLTEREVTVVHGFQIPSLINHHDELLIVEISLVAPPFVLDFATASLDQDTLRTRDDYEEWLELKKEIFGTDWPVVRRVLSAFRSHGVFLVDVHRDNIRFR
ncbi:MAG: hypothetical protein KF777_17970 [Planctomycetaceae bacterium]|nr:hypothetical protein [Planctomycetaceae bacterium]